VQDEVSFVVFGVSVLVALTRIGPGLAALGASRNPEGVVAGFRAPPFGARRSARSDPGRGGKPSPGGDATDRSGTTVRARASSSRGR
jgi:hypothetical protein